MTTTQDRTPINIERSGMIEQGVAVFCYRRGKATSGFHGTLPGMTESTIEDNESLNCTMKRLGTIHTTSRGRTRPKTDQIAS